MNGALSYMILEVKLLGEMKFMGILSACKGTEELVFTAICDRSSKALKEPDEKSKALEFTIMRAFLSAHAQMEMRASFDEETLNLALHPYTRANIVTVIYKLLKKTEPLEDLKSRLKEFEAKISTRSLEECNEILGERYIGDPNASRIHAHEVLPRFFLGDITAASAGTVTSGEHEGEPYDLMVKVTGERYCQMLCPEAISVP